MRIVRICRVRLGVACLAGAFGLAAAATGLAAPGGGGAPQAGTGSLEHFDPLGKAPSKFTIELRKGVKATLPFEDQRDFEEAKKGFIAEPPYKWNTIVTPSTVIAGRDEHLVTPDFEILPGPAPKQHPNPPKPFEVLQQIDIEHD